MVLIPPGAVGLKFWSQRAERLDAVITTAFTADPGDYSVTGAATSSVLRVFTFDATTAGSYALTGTDALLTKLSPFTWNPSDKSPNVTLSNSDKTATLSSSIVAGVRSIRKNANGVAGKYYAEFVIDSPGAGVRVGVSNSTLAIDSVTGAIFVGIGGQAAFGSTSLGFVWGGGPAVANDVISFAWDTSAELIWFRLNNRAWNNNASNDPATGIGGYNVSAAPAADFALWMSGTASGNSTTLRTQTAELTQPSLPSGFTSWMGESLSLLVNKTLTADAGSYALTGAVTTNVLHKWIATAAASSYALTGAAATVRKAFPLAASAGSYALTGTDALLTKRTMKTLAASAGSYALTGIATGVLHRWVASASAGSYALTGVAATVTKLANKSLAAGVGSYALTGTAAAVLRGRKTAALTASYALTGVTASLRYGRNLAAVAGSYALIGTAAAITRKVQGKLVADPGSYALTGIAAGVLRGRKTVAGIASYSLTGAPAALTKVANKLVPAGVGNYALTGTPALVKYNWTLRTLGGSYSVAGSVASLRRIRRTQVAVGSYAVSGAPANLVHLKRYVLDAGAGNYALIGKTATLFMGARVPPWTRIVEVSVENRHVRLMGENRVAIVPPEQRTVIVPAKIQMIDVGRETRFVKPSKGTSDVLEMA